MKRQEMAVDPFQFIDKKTRKQLTRRSDWIGLSYLCRHFATIGGTGFLVYLTYGTFLIVPAMFVARDRAGMPVCADARVQSRHRVSLALA